MRGFAHGKISAALAIGLVATLSLPPAVLEAQDVAQPPTFKPEELEQLVAPIALYPDGLLAQVLMASTYPLEVVEAARFAKANPNLKDEALNNALKQQSWDPSVKSLLSFPQVLTMMDEKLDWTQKLGDAFLAQQKDVMDAVQRLRGKAQAEGNLKSNEQQTVTVEEQPPASGSQVIVIQPSNPQVVYVPTYNPTVVYGAWPYPAYPPAYYYPPGYVATAALVSFGVGLAVGSAYYGGCGWGHGDVDINTNRYNNFNQNVSQNYNRSDVKNKVEGGKWQHNPEHRKGVEYRDRGTQDRYGRGQNPKASTREAYRGRAEQGRQQIAREGPGNMQNQIGQGGRGGNGPGSQRPSASTRPAGGAGGGGAAGSQRPSERPSASTREAGGSRGGGDRGGAFQGSGSGAEARRDSDRGRTSRESASSRGSRGGGGSQRSGGYGGGGGRGGGGRSGGGRGGGGRR
ncbi:MAG TPA: DUF3300 domain-containing protein [Myxococcota bacterium]|nr:DUF3300 domain-containing protein [Myxococcota bacterium]